MRIGLSGICGLSAAFGKPKTCAAIYLGARRFPPRAAFEIPPYRFRDPFFKGPAGSPSEFAMGFRCINRITKIMAGPILHKSNKRARCWFPRNHLVEDVTNQLDDVEVGALAVASKIVFL